MNVTITETIILSEVDNPVERKDRIALIATSAYRTSARKWVLVRVHFATTITCELIVNQLHYNTAI